MAAAGFVGLEDVVAEPVVKAGNDADESEDDIEYAVTAPQPKPQYAIRTAAAVRKRLEPFGAVSPAFVKSELRAFAKRQRALALEPMLGACY